MYQTPIFGSPADEGALAQIRTCARTASKVALVADHHEAYAVPIHGVVATPAFQGQKALVGGSTGDISVILKGSSMRRATRRFLRPSMARACDGEHRSEGQLHHCEREILADVAVAPRLPYQLESER